MKTIEKETIISLLKDNSVAETARKLEVSTHTLYKKMKLYDITKSGKISKVDKSIIGQKFGRLLVVNYSYVKAAKSVFKCKCDCGNDFEVYAATLKSGLTKSCGCLKKEIARGKGYEEISYQFFRRAQKSASERNIEFCITIEDIWEQYIEQRKKCYLSQVDICFFPDYNQPQKQTASVDRLDNNLGYVKSNIVIVHKRINYIKGNMSINELAFWAHRLSENLPNILECKHTHMLVNSRISYEVN